MLEIWPAIAVAGICFAIPQYLMSNFHGPWLVDIVASVISMGALVTFMKFWKPKRVWRFPGEGENVGHDPNRYTGAEVFRAWVPVDRSQRLCLHLGHAAGQEIPRRPLRAEVPGPWTA